MGFTPDYMGRRRTASQNLKILSKKGDQPRWIHCPSQERGRKYMYSIQGEGNECMWGSYNSYIMQFITQCK